MILQDYDAAPDGQGTFERLNQIFSSVSDALWFHEEHLRWCTGRIERLDGTFIQSVRDAFDEQLEPDD